jgi:hypothetical protein
VLFADFCSTMENIQQPGLSQGSSLSLILYILYNGNLLLKKINTEERDMRFVDDYTAWVVDNSAEENILKLQKTVIPRVVD